jgi:hypothetical protein
LSLWSKFIFILFRNEKKQKYEQKGLSGEFAVVTDVTLTLSFGKNRTTWTHLDLENSNYLLIPYIHVKWKKSLQ